MDDPSSPIFFPSFMARKQSRVGIIGLGIIGSRVAASLRAARFAVAVWNRTPKPAPNFLGSPSEVAKDAQIIQLFVADARAVFEVIEAMGDALTPDHIILCCATIGPDATRTAASMVHAKGAKFLDAPFTGSKAAADARQLVYYVGGDEPSFQRARPVLEASSKAIIPIGRIGDAAIIKVATNLISAASIQALSEAFALVTKSGLDPEVLAAAMAHNACRSGAMELKLPKMTAGDYEPHFSLKHMSKDVQLGLDMARDLDLETPIISATGSIMAGALDCGWGDLDFSALFKIYEQSLSHLPENKGPITDSLIASPLEVVPSIPESAKPASDPLPDFSAPPAASENPQPKRLTLLKRFLSTKRD